MGPSGQDDTLDTVVEGASAPSPPERSMPDLVGITLGRFHVTGLLGQGAMGIVFLAEDPNLGRRVAIKLIHERVELESRGRQRLEREARTLASLSHPNVVHVYEIGSHGGRLYVAMEHVAGRTLRVWLGERTRAWPEILTALCAAGDGLAAAHRSGIVHRDFKPDNVIVDEDERPRVLDFGLAVAAGSEDTGAVDSSPVHDSGVLTATGTVMGTPAYMAPEQHAGAPPDARSDQFSFCVALYEALWGKRPFTGDSFEELREAIIRGEVAAPPPHHVPRAIVAALRRGLSKSPGDRFETMGDLLAALREGVAPNRWRTPVLAATAVAATAIVIAWAPWSKPAPAPATADVPTVIAVPAPEIAAPWRPTLRPLTKTATPGVEAAGIDRAGAHILYTHGKNAWHRAIDGGEPTPMPLPASGEDGSGTPWLVGYAPQGGTFAVVDAVLWHLPAGPDSSADARALVRDVPSLAYVEIASDGALAAGLGDLQLVLWNLADGTSRRVELAGEYPAGMAWNDDGTRIAVRSWPAGAEEENLRVLDRAGEVLATLRIPASDVEGLAWIGDDALVLAVGDTDELVLQCVDWSDADRTLQSAARSEPLQLPWSQGFLIETTADHRALLTVAREIEDVAIGPIDRAEGWHALSPGVDAGNSSAAWRDSKHVVMWSDRDLRASVVVDDLAGTTTTLAVGGPPREVAVTRDGTLVVAIRGEDGAPARLTAQPPGATEPYTVAGMAELAAELVDLRCDGITEPRTCIAMRERDGARTFESFTVDATPKQVARATCPTDHYCLYGGFSPAGGAAVLLPTADFRRLDVLRLDDGSVTDTGIAIPAGYDVGSAALVPNSRDVIATLTATTNARGEAPGYVIARLSPGKPSRTLWRSGSTYAIRPVVSPDGRRVAVDISTFHEEAMLLEGAAHCRTRSTL